LTKQQLKLLTAVLCLTSAITARAAEPGQAQAASPTVTPHVAMTKWWWKSWLDWCDASPSFLRIKLGDVVLRVPSNYSLSFNLVEGPIRSTYKTKFNDTPSPTTGKQYLYESAICQSPDDQPFVVENIAVYLVNGFNSEKFELVGTTPPVTVPHMKGSSIFMQAYSHPQDEYMKSRPDLNGSVIERCEGYDVVEYIHKTEPQFKWWQAVFTGSKHTTPDGNPLSTGLAHSSAKRPFSIADYECDDHRLQRVHHYKWTNRTMMRWTEPSTNKAETYLANDQLVRRFICNLQTDKIGPCKQPANND